MAAIILKNQISAAYQDPQGELAEEYHFIKSNIIQAMVSVPLEIIRLVFFLQVNIFYILIIISK